MVDGAKCSELVYWGPSAGSSQCARKAGFGKDGLYCKQHSLTYGKIEDGKLSPTLSQLVCNLENATRAKAAAQIAFEEALSREEGKTVNQQVAAERDCPECHGSGTWSVEGGAGRCPVCEGMGTLPVLQERHLTTLDRGESSSVAPTDGRFRISLINGAYKVSIPSYQGGEVVPAEVYDAAIASEASEAIKERELREAVLRVIDDGHWMLNSEDESSEESAHRLAFCDALLARLREVRRIAGRTIGEREL